ncbi:dipeptidyl peptidase 3 isoform X1 [Hydra vulgaris]|uniref:dipeptidyl peptidase 3 isoform X1 n=1 Tax=Hydra vulgaris TaxID=6087 RepID=UPI001F5EE224|nr:dipeptidyl peptidase 3-like [Hydra vulgaris]
MAALIENKNFVIPNSAPVALLDCSDAFRSLTDKEKRYAHYMAKACNEGALIVLLQTSPESPGIFLMLQRLFSEQSIESLKNSAFQACRSITDDDFQSLLTYGAGFYSNMGNYKSFGDTKIVPAITKDKFQEIIYASEAFKKFPSLMESLWCKVSNQMYCLEKRHQELGLGEKGVSTYYSSNVTDKDVSFVQDFMIEKGISPYNTRLFKHESDQGVKYELRLASAASSDVCIDTDDSVFPILGKNMYNGSEINITRGDYAPLLKRVIENLQKAKEFAANTNEECMIDNYIKSFNSGSIDAHKEGSRFWIRNQGPIIENYIGFIESYRDPYGVRGEFEGFVSMVNKEMSKKFGQLVESAPSLLKLLPWPAEYEKDVFLKPDFTSLDVLVFAGSGIPAGINIPNYDDIRQNEGFKNVSLGNVLQARSNEQEITFLSIQDCELYSKYKSQSFEVQVGLHELLGHGSGKLFHQNVDGSFNFDKDKVKHLELNQPITKWYLPCETWDTKFSSMASSYEECRAECVGLYLSLEKSILKIFGFEEEIAEDILYVNWLNMVRAGLLGLEFYSPESKSWKQAHMNARYVILQVLIEAGENFVELHHTTDEVGKPDILIKLNRDLIKSVGKKAISVFLMRLQLYKSTADVESAQHMYSKYSDVSEKMLEVREIVMSKKKPRLMYVQVNTEISSSDGDTKLHEYPATSAGLIESFNKRYPNHDTELENLWVADMKFHFYSSN